MTGVTILIVDDEADMLDIIKFSLESQGYQTLTASNVAAAISALRHQPVDLVLTDMRLPGGSGLQILAEGKRIDPALTVLLMTGFADIKASEAIALGAGGVLAKPFHHQRLLDLVHQHLGERP